MESRRITVVGFWELLGTGHDHYFEADRLNTQVHYVGFHYHLFLYPLVL